MSISAAAVAAPIAATKLVGPHVPPRVSVGMPVYNGELHIEEALRSLLAQDFTDFELIISDNGSTDGTEAICREYAGRDPRIRYYRQPQNRGAAWNFNEVFRLARGEYFRWACHDDACAPSHLRSCVELLDASPPSVVLVYTRTMLLDESGQAFSTSHDELDTRGLPAHRRFQRLAERLRYANVLFGLVRRDALARTRLLGAYESSDYVLLAELSLLGEFAEIPSYLFKRRVHPQMSRRANRTATSIAQWFDPSQRRRIVPPQVRLFAEYANTVRRAQLTRGERLRTALALRSWARRTARPLLKEILSPIARRLPRSRVTRRRDRRARPGA